MRACPTRCVVLISHAHYARHLYQDAQSEVLDRRQVRYWWLADGRFLMHAGQLFSEHFLTDGIRTTDAYKRRASDPSSASDVRRRLEDVYEQFPFASSPDEAQTEQDLIFQVLEVIGWDRDTWLVQPRRTQGAIRRSRCAPVPRPERQGTGERRNREGSALPAWRRHCREQTLGSSTRPACAPAGQVKPFRGDRSEAPKASSKAP